VRSGIVPNSVGDSLENIARCAANLFDHLRRIALVMLFEDAVYTALVLKGWILMCVRTDQRTDQRRERLWIAAISRTPRVSLIAPLAWVISARRWVKAGEDAVVVFRIAKFIGDDGCRVRVTSKVVGEKPVAGVSIGLGLCQNPIILFDGMTDKGT